MWQRDDYETDQILNKEALRVIRDEPLQVARKSVVGLFTFWYQLTSLKNSLLALVCAIGAWALAIVGWMRAHRERLARLAAAAARLLPEHRARAAARSRPLLGARSCRPCSWSRRSAPTPFSNDGGPVHA